jgi:uncharacterized protein (DUF2267 family)
LLGKRNVVVEMTYDEFVEQVQQRAELADREEAERTTVVVLQAICDRITGDEAWDLLAQLPARLKLAVVITQAPLPLPLDEFIDWVAEKLGVPHDEARRRIRAVFATLREAVS